MLLIEVVGAKLLKKAMLLIIDTLKSTKYI